MGDLIPVVLFYSAISQIFAMLAEFAALLIVVWREAVCEDILGT